MYYLLVSLSTSTIRVLISFSNLYYIIKAIIRKYLSTIQLLGSCTKSLETLTSSKGLREDGKISSK